MSTEHLQYTHGYQEPRHHTHGNHNVNPLGTTCSNKWVWCMLRKACGYHSGEKLQCWLGESAVGSNAVQRYSVSGYQSRVIV